MTLCCCLNPFVSTWKILISVSCREVLVVINSFRFYLSGEVFHFEGQFCQMQYCCLTSSPWPQNFEYIILLPLAYRVSAGKSADNLMEAPFICDKLPSYCFQESLFVFDFRQFGYTVSQCGFFRFIPKLVRAFWIYFFLQIWEVWDHYFFNKFSTPFSLSPSWISVIYTLGSLDCVPLCHFSSFFFLFVPLTGWFH